MPRTALSIAIALAALGGAFLVEESRAELENQVFTSLPDRLALVVPRGWRATDQPSYPGMLLRIERGDPEARIALTAQAFTHERYCSWSVVCRTSHDSLSAKAACALRSALQNQKMRVGPVEAGPKENEEAGLPSVWFEFDDGKRFLRQAVAVDEDRIISLVLSAPSAETRSAEIRSFEQTLRTLRTLTPEELGAGASGSAPGSAGSPGSAGATGSAGSAAAVIPGDAGVLADSGVAPAGTSNVFESAPAAKRNPVGPCTK